MAAVIALSQLKGADIPFLQTLRERGIAPEAFLRMSVHDQGATTGLAHMPRWERASIDRALKKGEEETCFCMAHGIRVLSPAIEGYPRRLDILDDAPRCLFMLGDTDLDAINVIGIVGTRRITARGVQFCTSFVKDLADRAVSPPVIVSGLAYGTDAEAHKAALDNGLPTVGVLAHGLGMIYPAAHRELAKKIISSGGALVTEYLSGEKPFRGNFLERNRIIAALADGVMVVESAIKGGAMNTARSALNYGRTVMAVPGRPADAMSLGCNELIRSSVAALTMEAGQACDSLGWETKDNAVEDTPTLFREPDEDLMPVYRLLQESAEPVGVDTIMVRTGIPMPRLSTMLFMLEEDGFVSRLPNNRYTLL